LIAAHGGDAKCDGFLDGDAEFLGTIADVVAIDTPRARLFPRNRAQKNAGSPRGKPGDDKL